MAISRHYSSAFTLQQLQDRCNEDEDNLNAKLQSLTAVKNTDGVKVTEGMYKEQDDFDGLGLLTIEKFSAAKKDKAAFGGSAFILTVNTKVLVFREEEQATDEEEEVPETEEEEIEEDDS